MQLHSTEGCLSSAGASGGSALVVQPCDPSSSAQQWQLNSSSGKLTQGGSCLDSFNGQDCRANPIGTGRVDLYGCNGGKNQQWEVDDHGRLTDACGACLGVKSTAPPGTNSGVLNKVQIWAKPQPDGAYGVLLINASPKPTKPYQLSVSKLNPGLGGDISVRDIWAHKDLGRASGGGS